VPGTGVAGDVDEAAPVRILTPTAPVRCCSGQVSVGGQDLLTEELYTAWEVVEAATTSGGDPWPALLAPPPLHRRHAAWAVLTIRAVPGEAFATTAGRVRGRVRALLTALERAGVPDGHAWPHPLQTGPGLLRYAVGLGQTPPDAAGLARAVQGWTDGLPGTTVEWAPGGGLPVPP